MAFAGASISKTPLGALHNHPNKSSASSFTVSSSDWGLAKKSSIQYPTPPQDGGVVDDIFGIEIKDPWRSLEQLESDSTKEFIQEQNKLSIPKLVNHPLRDSLEKAVESCYNHERMDTPQLQADGYYYWSFNTGTWPRDILVRSKNLSKHFGKQPGSDGPEIFFDLNKEDDTSLYAHSFSPSGKLWCAVLQTSGSDWQSLRVYDTVTKQVIERPLGGSKFTFGVTWVGEEGFIYKRSVDYDMHEDALASADGAFGMFYHRIGESQTCDVGVLCFSGDFIDCFVGKAYVVSSDLSEKSTERSWLTMDVYRNTNPETELLIVELPDGPSKVDGHKIESLIRKERKWVTKGYTGETRYVGSTPSNSHLFYTTADGHSTGRIVSFDTADWDRTEADSVLPIKEFVSADDEGHQLSVGQVVGGKLLVLIYLKHACASVVFVDASTGKQLGSANAKETKGDIALDPNTEVPVPEEELRTAKSSDVVIPEHGSIKAISSRFDTDDFYFAVDTWVAPSYVLKGQVIKKDDGLNVDISSITSAHSPAEETLICSQVFYDSHDGIKIPMFICHPHDLDLSKPNPTLVHAYGGFCAPLTPHYDAFFASFMRNLRGIVAIAGIRGGGEYGKRWHDAALGIKRYIGWDDFSYAAKYLQDKGLTTPQLTATYGTSNGGLLVTACVNRYPELFNTVFADVAITDLVRYHKFTLGRMWTGEYGSPEDPNILPTLFSTSPLHNVREDVGYPSILVTTADHDTRVVPGHSLKYLAEVQNKHPNGKHIVLGRLYENAGHEASTKTLEKKVEEVTDRLIFTLLTMKP
ncbi:uncharacterized protein IL334_001769 [Kwoniella shivajii]|uniref:Prolyl endopeptidase n=1 Tax=Kwoniella shivajii TaxID=564305 RepID=A0ABZ1CT33_9TREE|nr:hypothetical protein IL334_001769 [Kwoniella shivajii]